MAITIGTLAYQVTADSSKFTKGMTATKRELRDAKKVIEQTKSPTEKYGDQIAKLDNLHKKGALTQKQYNAAVSNAKKGLDQATASTSKMGAATKVMIGNLGAQAVTAGIRTLTSAIGNAVNKIREYNKAFAESTAIMGGLTDVMTADLAAKSRQVAFQLGVDAKDVAGGYQFLAAAGLDAEKSLAAIGTSSTFARAGSMDLALATDLLTDAQSSLGLASDDTETHMKNMRFVANQLASAYQTSNASIEQFSAAITNGAGPSLRALNKDIQEGLSVLKVWASTGFAKGEDAGTKFAIVLRDLQKASVNNAGAWDKAGLSLFDASGNVRNLADIVEQLTKKMEAMSDRQKIVTFQTLGFTFKSLEATKGLLGQADAMRKYEAEARATGEVIEDIAANKVPPLEKAISQLSQTWDLFMVTLLTDPLSDATEIAEGNISTLGESLAEVLDTVDKLSQALDNIATSSRQAKEFFAEWSIPELPSVSQITGLGGIDTLWGLIGQQAEEEGRSSADKFREAFKKVNTPLKAPASVVPVVAPDTAAQSRFAAAMAKVDAENKAKEEAAKSAKLAANVKKKSFDTGQDAILNMRRQIILHGKTADQAALLQLYWEGVGKAQLTAVASLQKISQQQKFMEASAERRKTIEGEIKDAAQAAQAFGDETAAGSLFGNSGFNKNSRQAIELEYRQANPDVVKRLSEQAKQAKLLAEIKGILAKNPPLQLADF